MIPRQDAKVSSQMPTVSRGLHADSINISTFLEISHLIKTVILRKIISKQVFDHNIATVSH